MSGATGGSRLREHAVFPGTFDPVTRGHRDIIDRARHLFVRITVLVAVNADKQPASTPSERAIRLRRELPATWDNVSVAASAGLTVEFCRQHDADVIIRGVRNGSDLRYEYQLAAMNEDLGHHHAAPACDAQAGGHVLNGPARTQHLTGWLARLSRPRANLRTYLTCDI
jgi:pantetheine-phosphate adenylyltransferase